MKISYEPQAWDSFQTTIAKLAGFTVEITPEDGSEPFNAVLDGGEAEPDAWEDLDADSAAVIVRKAGSYGEPVGDPFTVICSNIKVL